MVEAGPRTKWEKRSDYDQPIQADECRDASWYGGEQTELATEGSDEDEGKGPWQRKGQAEGAPIEDWSHACEFRREVASHLSLDEWRSLVADELTQAQSAADLSELLWRCLLAFPGAFPGRFGGFCSTQANLIASTSGGLETLDGRDVVPIPPCTLRMLPKAGQLKHATPLTGKDVIANDTWLNTSTMSLIGVNYFFIGHLNTAFNYGHNRGAVVLGTCARLQVQGVAASVKATDLASDLVRDWLLDPEKAILLEDEWPETLPKARVHCHSTAELLRCLVGMYQRGILVPIRDGDVFHARGHLHVWGPGAIVEWRRSKGCLLCVSATEGVAAVYRYRVPGHLVGCGDTEWVRLAFAVIPMGFKSAVSIFQHLQSRLGFLPPPSGAGFDGDLEWRRDGRIPIRPELRDQSWVQYYLDDFDTVEVVDKEMAAVLQGTMSSMHQQQREAYRHSNIQVAEDKAHYRELRVERMGALVDGDREVVSSPVQKNVGSTWAYHFGRAARVLEFRRVGMSSEPCLVSCKLSQRRSITKSNASCTGGGLSASSGGRGSSLLHKISQPSPLVLLVSRCDSLASGRVALGQLPVNVSGFATSVADPQARRLQHERWGGLVQWSLLSELAERDVVSLSDSYNGCVDLVLVVASCPVSDFARSNGDIKRGLISKIKDVCVWRHEHFICLVHWCVENCFPPSGRNHAGVLYGFPSYGLLG
eukprot:6281187-Amphidinium_carterae.3